MSFYWNDWSVNSSNSEKNVHPHHARTGNPLQPTVVFLLSTPLRAICAAVHTLLTINIIFQMIYLPVHIVFSNHSLYLTKCSIDYFWNNDQSISQCRILIGFIYFLLACSWFISLLTFLYGIQKVKLSHLILLKTITFERIRAYEQKKCLFLSIYFIVFF